MNTMMIQKKVTKVKLLLQGKVESFEEYETRLNKGLSELHENDDVDHVVVLPSAAADGRLCCCINFQMYVSKPKKI